MTQIQLWRPILVTFFKREIMSSKGELATPWKSNLQVQVREWSLPSHARKFIYHARKIMVHASTVIYHARKVMVHARKLVYHARKSWCMARKVMVHARNSWSCNESHDTCKEVMEMKGKVMEQATKSWPCKEKSRSWIFLGIRKVMVWKTMQDALKYETSSSKIWVF